MFRTPRIFRVKLNALPPVYLIGVFALWIKTSAGDYIKNTLKNPDMLVTFIGLIMLFIFTVLMIHLAGLRWKKSGFGTKEVAE